MAQKSSDTFGGIFVGLIILAFLFAWLSIPGEQGKVNAFQISSLTFANGVFDGWADDLAVRLFYSDSAYEKQSALSAFREAVLKGEQEYPMATAIFNLIGAIFSIGGVIAVWLARSAASSKEAFNMGFWAEIVESVVFHAGYYATVGKSSVSGMEVILTLVVAVFMGAVATQLNKKHRLSATARQTA